MKTSIQVIGYGTIYWPNTDFPMSRGAQKLCMDVEIYVKNYDMICNSIRLYMIHKHDILIIPAISYQKKLEKEHITVRTSANPNMYQYSHWTLQAFQCQLRDEKLT